MKLDSEKLVLSEEIRIRLVSGTIPAHVVLSVAILVEILFASLPSFLVFFDGDLPFIILGIISWPLAFLSVGVSLIVHPTRWYAQFRKIDAYFIYALFSSIAYGFAAYDKARKEGAVGLSTWQWHACVAYVVLVFAFVGQIRVCIKWYPFSTTSIFVYKLVRCYHLLIFLLITMINSVRTMITGPSLGYFSTTMTLVAYLLGFVMSKERAVRDQAIAARRKRVQEAIDLGLLSVNDVINEAGEEEEVSDSSEDDAVIMSSSRRSPRSVLLTGDGDPALDNEKIR
jgi:hypothetical protein